MNENQAISILSHAIVVATELLLPVLLVALVVGVAISLFQAATQVQEMTLTFAPKLAAVALVMVIMGRWMIGQLGDFTRQMFAMIPQLLK
jgi:flagellar biosynthesis protein FliQ